MKLSPNNFVLNDTVNKQFANLAAGSGYGNGTEYGNSAKKGAFNNASNHKSPINRNVVTKSVVGPLR